MNKPTREVSRIKEAYAKRDSSGKGQLYTLFNPASLYISQQREKAIISLLNSNNTKDLSDKTLLDIGCGNGGILRDFVKYGAKPKNCFGLDLLPDRIETAKQLSPGTSFQCANAERLPYPPNTFDIIIIFTVLTSIFDKQMKQSLSKEMLRVLKPEGFIIYYDYHMNNPKNPDVRGVKKGEIQQLFPMCEISVKRITLAPPLARTIAPISVIVCELLQKIPFLCTHYLGTIKKK